MRFCIRSQHRVFPLSCGPRVCMKGFREACTSSSNDNFQSLFLSLLEEKLRKVDFIDEQFLHKKADNKYYYVNCGATEDIPEDACSFSLKQNGELTTLNGSRWLKF